MYQRKSIVIVRKTTIEQYELSIIHDDLFDNDERHRPFSQEKGNMPLQSKQSERIGSHDKNNGFPINNIGKSLMVAFDKLFWPVSAAIIGGLMVITFRIISGLPG